MADKAVFISGLRASNDHGADERPKNFREAILWLDPAGMTPLTAMSAKMRKETTDDPEFSWYEEVQDAKRSVVTAISGTQTTGSSNTITLSSTITDQPAKQYKPGDLLLLVPAAGQAADYRGTGSTAPEIMRVTALGGTPDTQVVVTRGYAGRATVGTIVATDQLVMIGSAYAEGSGSANGISGAPTKNTNYTQIFKSAFNQTNTAIATKYRTGDAFANDRKRAMFRHSESLEQAAFWGIPTELAEGNEPIRTTGGLRYFLATNVNVNVGNITDDFFLDTLSPLFNYEAGGAGDQRICFLGNGALNAIQKVMRDSGGLRVNYDGEISFYGLNLLKFRIPQGSFFLKTHPLMNNDPVFRKSMFVLNGRGFIVRPLKGRDTKIQTNIQANDADQRKDQWLTETGYELQFERTQGYYGNITAA